MPLEPGGYTSPMILERRSFLQLTAAAGAAYLLGGCQTREAVADAPLDVSLGHGDGFLFFEQNGERFEVQPLLHRVVRLSARGEVLAQYGAAQDGHSGGLQSGGLQSGGLQSGGLQGGLGQGELNGPAAALRGPDGQVYIADRGNSRIQVFAENGAWLRSLGRRGEGAGELAFPAALAFDGAGDLWVADSLNHRVVVLDRQSGHQLASFGSLGTGPAQLNCPLGLALAHDGVAAVLDSGNGRIQRFDRRGRTYPAIELRDSSGRRALSPRGLTGDRLGTLYIADANGSALWRVDTSTERRERRPLLAQRKAISPLHVALQPGGALHIAAIAAGPAA